jgi:hypothetical protein
MDMNSGRTKERRAVAFMLEWRIESGKKFETRSVGTGSSGQAKKQHVIA